MDESRELYSREEDNSSRFEGKPWQGNTLYLTSILISKSITVVHVVWSNNMHIKFELHVDVQGAHFGLRYR